MPVPPAHPIVALLLKKLSPARLYLPALIIGSLVPDLATAINDWEYFSHTALGSIVFCLPVGLLTLKFFHLFRLPIVLAFPNPHRDALLPLCAIAPPPMLNSILSLLVAIWAHLAWDLFTHTHSWLLPRIPIMLTPLGGIPAYRLFWALSSLVGSVFLLLYYVRFVTRRLNRGWRFSGPDLARHLRWCCVLILPFIGAVPQALIDPYNDAGLSPRPLAMYYMGWAYVTIIAIGFFLRSRDAEHGRRSDSSRD